LWQVSGAHGKIDPVAAVKNMLDYHEAGLTTWDLADHYGPAEDFIGAFRKKLVAKKGQEALKEIQAFTKWVPRPEPMPCKVVEAALDVSRRRMDTPCIDLLQFHWWDYDNNAYIDALKHFSALRDEGKLGHVGLTNFDTERLRRIDAAGVKIALNQVQFSIVDRRPEVEMIPFCQEKGIYLTAYGSLCGGLLSDRYLGKEEPRNSVLNTASLRKYKQMIDAWGGWDLFQSLLRDLKKIADKHKVSIANVAVRYIMEKPMVAGVIVGARLGTSDNHEENLRVFSFQLDDEDRQIIDSYGKKSRNLFKIIGDCGDEYRR